MDVVSQLTRQFMDHMSSMYSEGYLDDQFGELQKLQDESSPNFVHEVVYLFFEESVKSLNILDNCMQKRIVNYMEVSFHVCKYKGTSASIGAQKVKNVCDAFINSCKDNSHDGCVECLQKLQHEFNVLKSKFDHLFMLKEQIVAASGKVPARP